uniref:Uncharacterized protein n=1 Tax=Anopheles quadriannulatus TaxID=34691 RepID=A0A182WSD4_ANOQN
MDPAVAWYQEEQDGPAKHTWMRIWESNSDLYGPLHANYGPGSNNGQEGLKGPGGARGELKQFDLPLGNTGNSELTTGGGTNGCTKAGGGGTGTGGGLVSSSEKNYNPVRKKLGSMMTENKASTFNMNKQQQRLTGVHGGCPWRPPNFKYGRGIIG